MRYGELLLDRSTYINVFLFIVKTFDQYVFVIHSFTIENFISVH